MAAAEIAYLRRYSIIACLHHETRPEPRGGRYFEPDSGASAPSLGAGAASSAGGVLWDDWVLSAGGEDLRLFSGTASPAGAGVSPGAVPVAGADGEGGGFDGTGVALPGVLSPGAARSEAPGAAPRGIDGVVDPGALSS